MKRARSFTWRNDARPVTWRTSKSDSWRDVYECWDTKIRHSKRQSSLWHHGSQTFPVTIAVVIKQHQSDFRVTFTGTCTCNSKHCNLLCICLCRREVYLLWLRTSLMRPIALWRKHITCFSTVILMTSSVREHNRMPQPSHRSNHNNYTFNVMHLFNVNNTTTNNLFPREFATCRHDCTFNISEWPSVIRALSKNILFAAWTVTSDGILGFEERVGGDRSEFYTIHPQALLHFLSGDDLSFNAFSL